METNVLKKIFFDEHGHWDRFVANHKDKLRQNVIKKLSCSEYAEI
ncbi:hypothetical protein [Cohnella sp.]